MQNWIKCSERMPDSQETNTVLGYSKTTGLVSEYFYDHDDESFSYYNFCGCHSFNTDSITHWQPLPEPPQE